MSKTTSEAFKEASKACDDLFNIIIEELKIKSFVEWLIKKILKK